MKVFAIGRHDDIGQGFRAIRKGKRSEPDAVEVRQIEGPEAQRSIVLPVIHQGPEARQARFITSDELE